MHGSCQEDRLYGGGCLCGAISKDLAAISVLLTFSPPARPAGHLVKYHSLCGYMAMVLT